MKKIIQFFKDSYGELRKVIWPTRDDVISSTKVVIISTVAIALVLSAFDFIIYNGIKLLLRVG